MANQMNEQYEKGGLVYTLPGTGYQVKLSLLLLKRALDKEYQFKIAAERVDAGKFDDLEIVILSTNKHRLYQLKHIENETKNKITTADLENERDGRFSLLKYFMSYRLITKTSPPNGLSNEFVIFTNVRLEAKLRENFENTGEDEILDFESFNPKKTPELLKLKPDSDLRKTLIRLLKKCSDLEQLQQKLVDCAQNEKVIDFKDKVFKKYQQVLLETVLDEDKRQFKHAFFQNDSKLSAGARLLQKHLLTNIDGISEKKLNIKKCTDIRAGASARSESIELPNDSIGDEEINEFLDKLVLAVDQPNETELSEIIEQTMAKDKDFNLVDNEFVASRVLCEMIDWTKEKEGNYMTQDSGKEMFKRVRAKLSKLYLVGPTLEHCQSLESFNLTFQENLTQFVQFLEPSEKTQICFVTNPQHAIFSSIKVFNTLKESGSYVHNDSFVFVRFETLLRLRHHVFDALQSSNLLIIELPPFNSHIDESFLQDILESIDANRNKKIVLIMTATNRKPANFTAIHCEDSANSLTDLTKESQDNLLRSKILWFQGREVAMAQFDDLKHLIDADILLSLINGEAIKIGGRLQELGVVQKYYIPRIIKDIEIMPWIKDQQSEFKIVYHSGTTDLNVRCDQDIVLISYREKYFTGLCSQFKNRNIHWIVHDAGRYVWKKSHGTNLSKLRKYIGVTCVKQCVSAETLEIGNLSKKLSQATQNKSRKRPGFMNDALNSLKPKIKVVILAAPPGMGKSTELTSLAIRLKDHNPMTWVLRINLVECSELFSKQKKKFNLAETKDFLHSHLSGPKANRIKGVELLEQEWFNQCFDRGKVIILFDGFDEISPVYKDKVIELLQTLKETPVEQIWVTTRPYGILTQLEDELVTLSHTIGPLEDRDIKKMLIAFWDDSERASEYADELMKRFATSTKDGLSTFLGNPLNVKICATVFKNAPKTSQKIDLAELYHSFFTILFDEVFIQEKNPGLHEHRHKIPTLDIIEEQRTQSLELHKKLALLTLFGEEDFKTMLPGDFENLQAAITGINDGKYKMGIIERIVGNRPVFVHKTYAEYFAALWLADEKNWAKPCVKNLLRNTVLNDQTLMVTQFLLFLLAKNEYFSGKYPIHTKVLQNDATGLRSLLEHAEDLAIKDECFNWTPLQYAGHCGCLEIADLILQYQVTTKNKVSFPEESLFLAVDKGLLHVAKYLVEVSKANGKQKKVNFDLAEAKDKPELKTIDRVEPPLLTAVRYNNFQAVKYFVEIVNCDTKEQSEDGSTPLHAAVLYSNLEMIEYLIDTARIDASTQNAYGFTALHLAILSDKIELVKYLVESAKTDLNIRCKYGNTPLHVAVLFFRPLIVEYLVGQVKVATNIPNDNLDTPLHLAARAGYHDCDQFILFKSEIQANDAFILFKCLVEKAKIDINLKNNKGETVLHIAVASGYSDIVRYLVEVKKIDKTTLTYDGESALHIATKSRQFDIVKYLIKSAKIDINIQNNKGYTALHIAAEENANQIIRYLVATTRIDLKIRTKKGETPLHIATKNEYFKIVKFLVEVAKIDIRIENNAGETALDMAKAAGNRKIIDFLANAYKHEKSS